MAHFARIRASGTWVGVVTSSEFEAFDAHQFAAINGDAGGTWNPAAPIVIGGYGLVLDSALTANMNVNIYGVTNSVGGINTSTISAFGAATVDSIDCAGTATVGSLSSNGNASINGGLSVLGTSSFDGKQSLNGGASLESGTIAESTGSGGYIPKTYWGSNENATLTGTVRYHRFIYPMYLTMTADRSLTIAYDGLYDGETIEIMSHRLDYKVNVTIGVTNHVSAVVGGPLSSSSYYYGGKYAIFVWRASTTRWEPVVSTAAVGDT